MVHQYLLLLCPARPDSVVVFSLNGDSECLTVWLSVLEPVLLAHCKDMGELPQAIGMPQAKTERKCNVEDTRQGEDG